MVYDMNGNHLGSVMVSSGQSLYSAMSGFVPRCGLYLVKPLHGEIAQRIVMGR